MSSKIYFSGSDKKRPLAYYVVNALSRAAHYVAPQFAISKTKQLLLTPAIKKQRTALPNGFSETSLHTSHGHLNVTQVGVGKSIVLTHGWSGSSAQFYPLMNRIAHAGFQAIAFDHVAHGKSEGKLANLPLFIKGLNAVIAANKQTVGVISHSMGTVAALNSVKHLPHFLIAPTFGFYDAFEKRILDTGIDRHLFKNVLQHVEHEHAMLFQQLLPEQHLTNQLHDVHIIHDRQDRFANFALSKQQSDVHSHLKLRAVNNLGHGRIINADETWQYLQQSFLPLAVLT